MKKTTIFILIASLFFSGCTNHGILEDKESVSAININEESLFDKKQKCFKYADNYEKEDVYLLEIFYSPKIDSCVAKLYYSIDPGGGNVRISKLIYFEDVLTKKVLKEFKSAVDLENYVTIFEYYSAKDENSKDWLKFESEELWEKGIKDFENNLKSNS